ncbi:MAG: hypothetical protein C4554_07655, partial [Dethiobacter sp.]
YSQSKGIWTSQHQIVCLFINEKLSNAEHELHSRPNWEIFSNILLFQVLIFSDINVNLFMIFGFYFLYRK